MKGIWKIALLAVALHALLGGCSAKRPARAAVPSTPNPTSLPATAHPGAEPASREPDSLPAEAAFRFERVVVPPLHPGEAKEPDAPRSGDPQPLPAKPSPGPARRPPAASNQRPAETEVPAEPDPAKGPDVRAPSLRPMLSDVERRQLEGQLNANLERARRNFTLIRESRLGSNERSVLEEAKSFATRADQLRGTDPVLANSLAERAAILTQELLRKQ